MWLLGPYPSLSRQLGPSEARRAEADRAEAGGSGERPQHPWDADCTVHYIRYYIILEYKLKVHYVRFHARLTCFIQNCVMSDF